MKRLVWIFLALVFVAVLVTATGFWLARGPNRLGGGDLVLTWRLSGALPDRPAHEAFHWPGFETEDTFASAYRALHAAQGDPGVVGMAVTFDGAGFGLAKAQEVRRQLGLLRAAGKFVDCYLETAGEGSNGTLDYFLATACDTISLSPAGEMNLLGLYADSLFFRGALDKLKIDPEFRHAGNFKSAAETFTEARHSPPAREALDAVLDAFLRQIVTGIAEGRRLEPATVLALIDRAPLDAETAHASGLVDTVAYPDEFADRLDARAGGATRLALGDYAANGGRSLFGAGAGAGGGHIAVVFAEGEILRGESSVDPWTDAVVLGSRDLTATLDDLREDSSVAGVVLRVDSPGGSALASDLMLRAVTRLAEAKPVVASFSDVAASGGYYIAVRARKIVAEAGSLTGSIGVVAGKFATRRLEEETLGVTRDPLARGRRAGLYSSASVFGAEEDEAFRASIARVYDRFLGHVAAGRGLERSTVERLAEGRVWVGDEAQRLGLVDEIGGLDRSIALARELANLPTDRGKVSFHPRPRGVFDQLFGSRSTPLSRTGATPARLAAALYLARFGGLPRPPAAWRAAARALERPPAARLELDPEFVRATRP